MAASLLKPEQIREIYNNPQNLVDDIQLKPTERPANILHLTVSPAS